MGMFSAQGFHFLVPIVLYDGISFLVILTCIYLKFDLIGLRIG